VSLGLGTAALAAGLNLTLALLTPPQVLSVIGPLVLYALGLAIAMPAITILALDCFPDNRGSATSMQGFIQMTINAAVASLAVPLLHAHWQRFALGQLAFLLAAQIFWSFARQNRPPREA